MQVFIVTALLPLRYTIDAGFYCASPPASSLYMAGLFLSSSFAVSIFRNINILTHTTNNWPFSRNAPKACTGTLNTGTTNVLIQIQTLNTWWNSSVNALTAEQKLRSTTGWGAEQVTLLKLVGMLLLLYVRCMKCIIWNNKLLTLSWMVLFLILL